MKTYRLLIFSLSTACCVLPCAAQTPALESNSVIRITPHRSELNGTVQVARFRSFSADTLIYTDSNQAGTEYRIRRDQIQRLELRTSGGRNTGKGLK